MAVGRSALLRGGLVLGVVMLGLVLASGAFLWWGTGSAWLAVLGIIGSVFALGWLYATQRPLPFANVALLLGMVAVFVVYFVGAISAHNVVMTLVGVDAEAVVDRTWTTHSRGADSHHCTLRRTDGTRIPRELATDCQGNERGETIPVVLDPKGRFAPVDGPKSDLSTTGELQVMGVAGLLLLVSIGIGSPPAVHTE